MKTLCELLAFAESSDMPVGWVNEDTLDLHWRCLTGQTGQRMMHTPHAPLLPFGQSLVPIGVAAPTVPLSDYLALNRRIWERDACQSISSIYEIIAAVTLAINHARQFLVSIAEGSIDGGENLRWALSQVCAL